MISKITELLTNKQGISRNVRIAMIHGWCTSVRAEVVKTKAHIFAFPGFLCHGD